MARPKKYKIKLTDDELKELKSVIRKNKTSKTIRCRCQIIIDLDESHGKVLTTLARSTFISQSFSTLRKYIWFPSGIWTGIITISVIVIQLYELLCNSQDYDIAKFWFLELRQKKYFQHIYSFYVSPHLWSVRVFII